MRIEILVDGSVEPQIYPLDKPKMMIGSGETCDIVVSSDNISRKHLMIVNEGDSYFVIDQGSTNGSYINEERLVPGRRTEFTSFFPVRLGDLVLITLLSDADPVGEAEDTGPLIPVPKEPSISNLKKPAPSRGGDESTKMISLSDLKKAKTSDLQARREVISKKKAAPAAKKAPVKTKRTKENEKFKILQWIIFVAVIGIGYYNIKNVKEEKPVGKIGEVVRVDPNAPKETNPAPATTQTAQANPTATQTEESRLIPDDQLIDRARYNQILADAKCITDIEKYFCSVIPGANSGQYGVVQIGTTIHILVDGAPYLAEARQYVVHPPPDASGNYPPEVYEPYKQLVMRTALAIFFIKAWPKDIDYEKIKDLKISVPMIEIWQGTTYIQMVAAGYPEMIREFTSLAKIENIHAVKEVGDGALMFTKKYYKTF